MAFEQAYLAAHPLPPGIVGSLGLGGYQLLVDVAGVGAGRLGPQAFLLVAPEPDPSLPDAGTQISLHHSKLRDEREMAAFTQLAAQLGYMRLSGYRLALERHGLRSKVNVVNPATGAIVATIPDRHGGRLFGGGASAGALWLRCARCRRRGRRRTSQPPRRCIRRCWRWRCATSPSTVPRPSSLPTGLWSWYERIARSTRRRLWRPPSGRAARQSGKFVPRDVGISLCGTFFPLWRGAKAGTTSHGRRSVRAFDLLPGQRD